MDHHTAATVAAGQRLGEPTQNETKASPLEGLLVTVLCGGESGEECGQPEPLESP